MNSFRKLWENFDFDKNKKERACLNAIKTGLKISDSFWDDFIRMSNNIDEFSKLLDIKPEKIRNWNIRIKKYFEDVKKNNKDGRKTRDKMINTGRSFNEQENL